MDMEREVDMALAMMPRQFSRTTGERMEPLSEVLTKKGLLYFSTLYRPYIVKNQFQLEEGSCLDYREVSIHGHLEFDESILYARCDQIEFIPYHYVVKATQHLD